MTHELTKDQRAMINAAVPNLPQAEREQFIADVTEEWRRYSNPTTPHVASAISTVLGRGK